MKPIVEPVVVDLSIFNKEAPVAPTNRSVPKNALRVQEYQNIIGKINEARNLKNIVSSDPALNEAFSSANQSGGEQAWNSFVQLGATIVGVGAQSLGSLTEGAWKLAAAGLNEKENFDFNDTLSQWGRELIEQRQKEFPIYRENPEQAFDFNDPGYWASMTPGTVGSMVGMLATVYGAGKFLKGASNLLGITDKVNKVIGGSKLINKTTVDVGKAVLGGGAMRHAENTMESHVVYQKTYDDLTALFESEDFDYDKFVANLPKDRKAYLPTDDKEELKKAIASEAGWESYRTNSANLAFDVIQMAGMMGLGLNLLGAKGVFRKSLPVAKTQYATLGKKWTALHSIANYSTRAGLLLTSQGLTEGAEELINGIGEKEGLHYGKYLSGLKEEGNFTDRLKDYSKDPHIWEQGFWGMLGGTVMGGTMSLGQGFAERKKGGFRESELREIEGRLVYAQTLAKAQHDIETKNINPFTGEEFEGTDDEITIKKQETLTSLKEQYADTMAKNAARTGNIALLKDWLQSDAIVEQFAEISKQVGKDGLFTENQDNIKKELSNLANRVEETYNYYKKQDKIISSNLDNQAIRDIIIGKSIDTQAEIKQLNKLVEKARKNKEEILANDKYLEKFTAEEKQIILDNVNKFAKKQALREIEVEINRQKKAFGNVDKINSLLDNALNSIKEEFGDTTIDKNIENELENHLTNGLSKELIGSEISNVFYDKLAKIKNVSDSIAMTEKVYHKTVASSLQKAAADLKAQKTTEYRGNFYNKAKLAIDKILDLDINDATYEASKAEIINTFNEDVDKTALETEFKITGINPDVVKKYLLDELNKSIPANVQTNDFSTGDNIDTAKQDEIAERLNDLLTQINTFSLDKLIANKKRQQQALEDFKNEDVLDNEAIEDTEYLINYMQKMIDAINNVDTNTENVIEQIDPSLDDTQQNNTINRTGGENVINTYLGPLITQNEHQNKSGDTVLESGKNSGVAANQIVFNYLKEGDEIEVDYANRDDFDSDFAFEENGQGSIVGRYQGVPIFFINTDIYLLRELELTGDLLDSLNNSDFEEIHTLLQGLLKENLTVEQKNDILKTLKSNKTFTKLFNYDLNKNEKLLKDIEHLSKLLYFGKKINTTESTIPLDIETLRTSLQTWFYKIQRDYNNKAKVKEQLSKTGAYKTTIGYMSSGTLIISKFENGNIKYRPLNVTLGKDLVDAKGKTLKNRDFDIPILVTALNNATKLISAVAGVDINPFYKADGTYQKGKAYSYVTGANGQRIPIPLISNTLNSKTTKRKYKSDLLRIEFTKKKAFEILQLLNNGARHNSPSIEKAKAELGNVVIINEFNEAREGEIDRLYMKFHARNPKNDATAHVTFQSGKDKYIMYLIDENEFANNPKYAQSGVSSRMQNADGSYSYISLFKNDSKAKIPAQNFDEVLNEALGGLYRSFNYDLLNKNESFTDPITGKTYTTYKEYLIKSHALLTYVGKSVDENGNKISNFRAKPDYNFDNRPLILNINAIPSEKPNQFNNADDIIAEVVNSEFDFVYDKAMSLGVGVMPQLKKAGDVINFRTGRHTVTTERGGYLDGAVYFTNRLNEDRGSIKDAKYLGVHELLHGIIDNSPVQKELMKQQIMDFNNRLISDIDNILAGKVVLDTNPVTNARLITEIRDLTKNRIVSQVLNFLRNENESKWEETITYAFTNENFAKLLTKIPSETVEETTKSFWQDLKDIIKSIIKAITGNTKLDELTNILDDIFKNTTNTTTTNGNPTVNTTETTTGTTTDTNEETNLPETGTIEEDLGNIDDIDLLGVGFIDPNFDPTKLDNIDYTENDYLNHVTVYQGYNNLDNREFNYFTLDEKEASNYGNNVRKVVIDTTKTLKGDSKLYKDLVNEDYQKTGTRFDILDNTEQGLQKQEQFFKFLKSRNYKGLDFTMFSDTQYIITFDNNMEIENIINILKTVLPDNESFALAVNTLPNQKIIHYKNIKQEDYAIPFDKYLNNPEKIDKEIGSAYKIYEFLNRGEKLPNNVILLDKNNKVLDGNNRIKAQLALGITDFKYVIVDDILFKQSNYKTIAEAYQKANINNDNSEFVKNIKNLIEKDVDLIFKSQVKFDNIDYNKAIPLTTDTQHYYKHYNLLNNQGKVKTVLNNEATKNWVKTLNNSPYFSFKLRNTPVGYKIFIFHKDFLLSEKLDRWETYKKAIQAKDASLTYKKWEKLTEETKQLIIKCL